MSQNGKHEHAVEDPIAIWEDLVDDMAEQTAEDRFPTEDDIRWSRDVDAMVSGHLARLRRQLTPAEVPVRYGVTIPEEIQALDRESLLARIENLRQSGSVRYAHQNLTRLSDRDLRTMLALLVTPTER